MVHKTLEQFVGKGMGDVYFITFRRFRGKLYIFYIHSSPKKKSADVRNVHHLMLFWSLISKILGLKIVNGLK